MRRWLAVWGHVVVLAVAAALYFFFVLPRWYELTGDTSPALGTAMRIVTGVLIGLNGLPVLLTLVRTSRPELGTAALALQLRLASIVLQVLSGVLIVGTAITEIWLQLDRAGRWLFGSYGAAAALALLAALAYYLSFVAELPPPAPKRVKPKTRRRRRKATQTEPDSTGSSEGADSAEEDTATAPEESSADEDVVVVEKASAQP